MIVLDASVWVSRFIPQDVHHHSSRRWLEAYTTRNGLIIAPVLLVIEVAGAISRRTGDPDLGRRTLATLSQLRTLRLVRLDRQTGLAAAGIAADLGLRAADATYVAVAQSLNISLLTWDDDQKDRAHAVVAAHTSATLDPRSV